MAEIKYAKYIISGVPEAEKEKVAKIYEVKGEIPGKMLIYTDGQYTEDTYYFTTQ